MTRLVGRLGGPARRRGHGRNSRNATEPILGATLASLISTSGCASELLRACRCTILLPISASEQRGAATNAPAVSVLRPGRRHRAPEQGARDALVVKRGAEGECRALRIRNLDDQLLQDGVGEGLEGGGRDDEGAGTADHVVAVEVLEVGLEGQDRQAVDASRRRARPRRAPPAPGVRGCCGRRRRCRSRAAPPIPATWETASWRGRWRR